MLSAPSAEALSVWMSTREGGAGDRERERDGGWGLHTDACSRYLSYENDEWGCDSRPLGRLQSGMVAERLGSE